MKKLIVLSFFIGAVIGFIAPLFIWYAFNAKSHQFFYDWQTLIAGIVAFIGAYATIYTMQTHERNRQERRALFLRACLPDAISEILSHLKHCLEYIYANKNFMPKPEINHKHIQIIKENIEYADTNTAKAIFRIVSFYQVFNARFISHIQKEPNVIKINEDMALSIIKMADYLYQLFPYARNEQEKLKLISERSPQEEHSTFRQLIGIMNYDKERYNALNQYLQR